MVISSWPVFSSYHFLMNMCLLFILVTRMWFLYTESVWGFDSPDSYIHKIFFQNLTWRHSISLIHVIQLFLSEDNYRIFGSKNWGFGTAGLRIQPGPWSGQTLVIATTETSHSDILVLFPQLHIIWGLISLFFKLIGKMNISKQVCIGWGRIKCQRLLTLQWGMRSANGERGRKDEGRERRREGRKKREGVGGRPFSWEQSHSRISCAAN